MSVRLAGAGAGLALLYVVVAVATVEFSSRPVLPLFDGFAPPTPYNWVNPPPERAGDNSPPPAADGELPLGPQGSEASNVSTDDAQAIVGLTEGSVPPHPPDTAVRVMVTPFDAGTLGPLPEGMRVVSNAYRVEMAYVPSETPVTQLSPAGTIALTAAGTAERFLYSADGQTWVERSFRPYGTDHGLFTELDAMGWFLLASAVGQSSGDDSGSDLLRGFLLVVAAVVPIVGAVLVVRLPSPVPATPPPRPGRPAGARPRSGAKRKRSGKRRR